MRLIKYNPTKLWNHPGNFFDAFLTDSFWGNEQDTVRSFSPLVDIVNEEDKFVIDIELAGVKKEDVSIDIKDNVMTIKGEKKYEKEIKEDDFYRKERSTGSFRRSFSLSDEVVTDKIDARFEDGVLKIVLPKNKTRETIKKITVH